MICREDAPLKPDPAPVRQALEELRMDRAWFVGDTPDDIVAARGAGVLPVGVLPPKCRAVEVERHLSRAGAAVVLQELADLEEILP